MDDGALIGVDVAVQDGDSVVVYRFDLAKRTVKVVGDPPKFDLSAVLEAKLAAGTTSPSLIGPQRDEMAGATDSWESQHPGSASALLMDMGLEVVDSTQRYRDA